MPLNTCKQVTMRTSLDSALVELMGDYCAPLRGIIEITPTEGQIMCPEGCIMPQRDAVDRRSRHPEGA